MKITLINPPIGIKEIYGKYSKLASFQPPIGLCALAGYLAKYGYTVRIIDANVLNLTISDIVKVIIDEPADLIGIYTNTSNYYIVSELTSSIKKVNRLQNIVLGGPHPSVLPEDTLKETAADYCVIGEGEETLLELARFIEDDCKDLSRIDGLAFKREGAEIIVNNLRKNIDNLDNLPFPAVHLLPPISRYRLYLLQYKRLPYMTVITSRGCPYRCIFCETPFGKAVRFHSPEYITDYIEYLSKEFGIKELHFCDDTFTFNETRVSKMCELIQKKKLDVTWYAATRANIKNKNLFYEMRKAGCWTCAIGVESGDASILKLIGKNISLDEIAVGVESVLKAGLILKTFFILGHPGETLETIERTIKFAISLKAHYPVFSLMTPFPGTEIWNTAEKYGTFERSDFRKLLISTSDPVFVPYGLTKELLLKKQREAFRRVYLNLGMIKRQIETIRSVEDFKKMCKAAFAFTNL